MNLVTENAVEILLKFLQNIKLKKKRKKTMTARVNRKSGMHK